MWYDQWGQVTAMRTSNRILMSLLVVSAVIAITLVFMRPRVPTALTMPVSVPTPAKTEPPVVLDQPPVVVRELEKPITPAKTEPDPVVTRVDQHPEKDSANLGPVKLSQPTAEERAVLEEKMNRFLKNQEEFRLGTGPH